MLPLETIKINGQDSELAWMACYPNRSHAETISLFLGDNNSLEVEVLEIKLDTPHAIDYDPVSLRIYSPTHEACEKAKDGQELADLWAEAYSLIEFENCLGLIGRYPTFRSRQGAELERFIAISSAHTGAEPAEDTFPHSPHYREVTYRGTEYRLTPTQAAVVQSLHDQGTLSEAELIDKVYRDDSPFSVRFDKLFKSDAKGRNADLWGTLIVRTKGYYSLSP